jgi:DNA-binding NarL/FixJ family response regulator
MPSIVVAKSELMTKCPLTPGQREILQVMVDKEFTSDQELAAHFGVCLCTVKTQLARINQRLGTHDRTRAVLLSLKAGWVYLSP